MANEFIARNGFIAQNNSIVTGSLGVTGSINIKAAGATTSDLPFQVRNSANTANIITINGKGQIWSNGAGFISTNTSYGELALTANTTGANNTAFGYNTLTTNTISGQNTGVGWGALQLTTGAGNTAIGYGAGQINAAGYNNVYLGYNAGQYGTTANNSVFIGFAAGQSSNATNGIFIGQLASSTGGNGTVAIGNSAGAGTGIHNVSLGQSSGAGMTTGNFNIQLGYRTVVSGVTTGNYNTLIGGDSVVGAVSNTAVLSDGAGNIAIRKDASHYVGIGYPGTATLGAKLDVKAQGALSTDIAFRVRNSADTADLAIINGLGNVGIGTTTPAYPLHINKDTTSNYIQLSGNSNKGLFATGAGLLAFDTSGNFRIYTGGVNERIIVDSTGNVGIGTLSPTAKLQIKASGALSTDIAFKVRNSADTADLAIINGLGNIGIGTVTPAYKLDVSGIGNFEGNLRLGVGHQFIFNNTNVGLYRDANTLRLGGFGGIEFLSSTAAISAQTIRMKIFDTGNVSINTTTDAGFRLDVSGSARITNGITVTGSLRGQVSALSISSNTASLDMASNNFFTLTLVNGVDTLINPTNIQPGQTVNIRLTQDTAGTGTVSFPSFVDQATGSLYTGSAVANAIDIVTMITFDTTTVYLSSIRNMI